MHNAANMPTVLLGPPPPYLIIGELRSLLLQPQAWPSKGLARHREPHHCTRLNAARRRVVHIAAHAATQWSMEALSLVTHYHVVLSALSDCC
jgi:hypothetical protein